MASCKHPKSKVTTRMTGYQSIKAISPDQRAAGNVCYVETCECGAVRKTNQNQNYKETTGWKK